MPGSQGKMPRSANSDFPTPPLGAHPSQRRSLLVLVALGFSPESPAQLEASVIRAPSTSVPSSMSLRQAKLSSHRLALSLSWCPELWLPPLASPFEP